MLKGLPISSGYALGQLYCLRHLQLESVGASTIPESEINSEIERFRAALEISRVEINQLLELPQIKSSLEISNIFQAHLTLIDDPDLTKEVTKRIREKKQDVQSVVSAVIKDYSDFFKNLPDPQFQGKAIDITDVGKRILKNCRKRKLKMNSSQSFSEGIILAAEDLTPSEIVSFNPQQLLGIVIEEGTPTSHASILARSLGIPALIQVKDLMKHVQDDQFAVIDGTQGSLITDPDESIKLQYEELYEEFKQKRLKIRESLSQPSISADGVKLQLKANISKTSDVDAVLANNADGVGLFRTEFEYLTRRSFPSEEELYDSYTALIKRLGGQNIVIRTIDIGGDKISHLMESTFERNPELGWRAIRMALDCEEVFNTQIRAILRAAATAKPGQVRVMFPMISNMEELLHIKRLIKKNKEDLVKSGVAVSDDIKIGIMIEIPSAAILADRFARELDFFAIGSNDLIQYTLAVDRTNAKVSHLYQPANPAVLALISHVVKAAARHNVSVSLCGEMAGDTKYTVLLVGLGLRELSMNAVLVPAVKQIIRNISVAEAERLVAPLLNIDTAEEVERALDKINARLNLS